MKALDTVSTDELENIMGTWVLEKAGEMKKMHLVRFSYTIPMAA